MIPIVPAIIPKSRDDLRDTLQTLQFSPEIHLDLVDGRFVKTISWPYEPVGDIKHLKSLTAGVTLEVDLMVNDPLALVPDLIEAGADMLVFHIETVSVTALRAVISQYKVSVGLSLHNHTPLEALEPYRDLADYVQLMGIAEIGRQGQPFDERVLDRLVGVKKRFPKLMRSVDGSVNPATVKRLVEVGAERLIVGSAIVGAADPALAHFNLSRLV